MGGAWTMIEDLDLTWVGSWACKIQSVEVFLPSLTTSHTWFLQNIQETSNYSQQKYINWTCIMHETLERNHQGS